MPLFFAPQALGGKKNEYDQDDDGDDDVDDDDDHFTRSLCSSRRTSLANGSEFLGRAELVSYS